MTTAATPSDWIPSRRAQVGMNLVGLALFLLGICLFGATYALAHGDAEIVVGASTLLVGLPVTLMLTFGLMVLHEVVHGLVARRYGGSPEYGAMLMGGWMPVFYCTSPGDRFSRRQFLVVLLAPTVVVSLVSAAVIAFVPYGGWLVIPAAVHLAGCVGDHWMAAVVLGQPPGTLVEDRKSNMRFHAPA